MTGVSVGCCVAVGEGNWVTVGVGLVGAIGDSSLSSQPMATRVIRTTSMNSDRMFILLTAVSNTIGEDVGGVNAHVVSCLDSFVK